MESALVCLAVALQTPPAWLAPYLPLAQAVVRAATSQSVTAALNALEHINGPLRFAEHAALPPGEPYESFIARTACVPTRDNLHDLFNALVWLTYPQTKRRLNVLQAQQIAVHGISGARGVLRDALTLFDENAAVLQAPSILVDALRARDWNALFIEQRAQWQAARLVVFGHALMEKLMRPRKAITAHVWLVEELTDDALAASLEPERLAAKPFLPLPVLGVPGWWAANESPGFYDDSAVFRPATLTRTRISIRKLMSHQTADGFFLELRPIEDLIRSVDLANEEELLLAIQLASPTLEVRFRVRPDADDGDRIQPDERLRTILEIVPGMSEVPAGYPHVFAMARSPGTLLVVSQYLDIGARGLDEEDVTRGCNALRSLAKKFEEALER